MPELVKRTGGEYTTADEAIAKLSRQQHYNTIKIARIRRVAYMPQKPRVLGLDCSSGGNVITWQRLGCECVVLEPSRVAIENSRILSLINLVL